VSNAKHERIFEQLQAIISAFDAVMAKVPAVEAPDWEKIPDAATGFNRTWLRGLWNALE